MTYILMIAKNNYIGTPSEQNEFFKSKKTKKDNELLSGADSGLSKGEEEV